MSFRELARTFTAVVAITYAGQAVAQTTVVAPGFDRMSFTGDGFTPSASALFEEQQRNLEGARHALSGSPKGDANYGIGLDLPPAIHSPALGLSYSSAAGEHSPLGRGWALDAGIGIRRVTGGAALAYEGADLLFRVSGAGLDGMITPDGTGGWTWISNTPRPAVITHNTTKNRWTVKSNGVTTVLDPVLAAGAPVGTYTDVVAWRTISTADGSSNRVDYVWDGPLLAAVNYGGQSTKSHQVTLAFDYEPRGYRSVDASVGFPEIIQDSLVAIRILTKGMPVGAPQGGYEFAYIDEDGEAFLESVWRTAEVTPDAMCRGCNEACASGFLNPGGACGQCAPVERHLVATMEYTTAVWGLEAGVGGTEFRETVWTSELYLGDSATNSHGASSSSATYSLLSDTSGDGIPDVVSDGVGLESAWGLLDWTTEHPMVAFEESPHHLTGSSDPFTTAAGRTETVLCDENTTITYTVKRLIDLNADGYLDAVYSDAVLPEPYSGSQYSSPAFCDMRREGGASPSNMWQGHYLVGGQHSWLVAYGTGDGMLEPVAVPAPVAWPGVSSNPKLPDAGDINDSVALENWLESQLANGLPQGSAIVDLLDITGDGLPDVLNITDTAHWDVYAGLSTGGFASVAQEWDFDSLDFGDLRATTSLVNGVIDTESILFDIPGGSSPDSGVPAGTEILEVIALKFASMRTKSRVVDINGDGLVDLVVAGSATWVAHLNTGVGFQAVSWSAPHPYLSVSIEGASWGMSCPIPGPEVEMAALAAQAPVSEVPSGRGSQPPAAPGIHPCSFRGGEPSRVMKDLLDVDGDGKVDYVDMVERVWYRNTGGGFADTGTPIPHWWPEAISASQRNQQIFYSEDLLWDIANGNQDFFENNVVPSHATNETLIHLVDLDRDGMLDAIRSSQMPIDPEARDPDYDGVLYGEWHVRFGTYPRPGLLSRMTRPTGADTQLDYLSSSWVWPSGDVRGNHRRTQRSDMVAAIQTTDPVTGHLGRRAIAYESGVCLPGACLGFESRTEADYRCDPELQSDCSGGPQTDWVWFGSTATEYALSRDHQGVAQRELWTPAGNPIDYIPGQAVVDRAFEVLGYEVVPYSSGSAAIEAHWASTRTVVDYGDGGSSGPQRTTELEVVRDAVGNVTAVHHTVPGTPAESVSVYTTWVASADGSLYVPREQRTEAWDHIALAKIPIERGMFAYDGGAVGDPPTAGLLTDQSVSSARADQGIDATSVSWTFVRGSRGQITDVYAPAGIERHITAFAFGGALPASEENALGHETLTAYDAFGRAVEVVDPNGVSERYELDVLGRVNAMWRTGAGGAEYLVSSTTRDECAFPNRIQAFTWDYAAPGAAGLSSQNDAILDGFGDVLQTARLNHDASAWVVQETHRDIAGAVVRESYPHTVAALSPDWTQNADSRFGTWIERDAMGVARVQWQDHELLKGRVDAGVPGPGQVYTLDMTGRSHLSTSDSRGRLVKVDEGQVGVLTRTTGQYRYDGRGRVTQFTDANNNMYRYAWDGAGRLRKSWRRAPSGGPTVTPSGCPTPRWWDLAGNPPSSTAGVGIGQGSECSAGAMMNSQAAAWRAWYQFEYDGDLPIAMYEGGHDTLAYKPRVLVATWDYDSAGRTVAHDVLRRGDDFDTYTWDWDLDPVSGVGWIGAPRHTTDPAGENFFSYAPGAFGGFGDVQLNARLWYRSNSADAFTYEYDFQRRAVHAEWPDGTEVDHTFGTDGWLESSAAVLSGGGRADVAYRYDDFGLSSGFGVTIDGVTQTSQDARTTALYPSSREWRVDGVLTHRIDWQRSDNLWLVGKEISPIPEPFSYKYDALGRVSQFEHGVAGLLERFEYDDLGNPTHVERAGTPTWDYGPATFGQVSGRQTPGNSVSEAFVYDIQGRLTEWDTADSPAGDALQRSLQYDGLGRLSRFHTVDSSLVETFADYVYGADNELLLEERVGPGSAFPGDAIYRFRGHRYDSAKDETLTEVLPMLRVRDGNEFLLVQRDHGEAALAVYDATGAQETFEITGVYGGELNPGVGAALIGLVGPEFPIDGLHGGDIDRERGVVHRGQRHAMLDDGRWLQPEPLLLMGGVSRYAARPLELGPVYSGGNPVMRADTSGFGTQEAMAIAPFALGMASMDGLLPVLDVAAVAVLAAALYVDTPDFSGLPTNSGSTSIQGPSDVLDGGGPLATPLPEQAGGTFVTTSEGEGAGGGEARPEADRQKGDRMRDGTAGEADQQLDEIESAQSRVRKGKSDQIIDSTEKSRQRADHRRDRIRSYEDALEEYEDFGDIPDEQSND